MKIMLSILVSLTLVEMMFAMGLRLTFTGLKEVAQGNRWLLIRALFANFIIIPLMTLLIILIFHVPPMIGIGMMILGVSPAAPYVLPFTILARGALDISIYLMIILAGISAIIVPLLLHLLLPFITPGDLLLTIDPLKMIGTLFLIQLLPLCLGLALKQWRPKLASAMLVPSARISKVLNFLMIAAIAIFQFRILRGMSQYELFIMILLVFIGIITGLLLGWPTRQERVSLSILTAMRNMSLGMGIAVYSFPDTPVISTVLAYSFVAGTIVLLFALIIRQASPR